MFRSRLIPTVMAAGAALLGTAGCGDDEDGGATRFVGSIILPGPA